MDNEDAKFVLAKRLVDLRVKNGISQEELAKKIGITRQSLSLYEKSERTINIDILLRISKVFDVSADYLLGVTDNKTTDTTLQATCNYTGLSEKAVETLHAINSCAVGENIAPKEKEDIDRCNQEIEKYQAILDDLLKKNINTSNLIEQYQHFKCDGKFEQANALDYCQRDNNGFQLARLYIDVLETTSESVSNSRTSSIEQGKAALAAISTLISSQGSEDFLTNLSLFMFTDFNERGNKRFIVKTSSKELPNNHSFFEFSSNLIDEALLSEIQNYIRGLKADSLSSVCCAIEDGISDNDEGDEENG